MTDLVLDSKIRVPRRRRTAVGRPRLLRRLDEATHTPLTFVSAPAGFGKTTLLTEWLATEPAAAGAAWVSLDVSDNDPVVFWRYVVAAVHAVRPQVATRAHDLLTAAQTPTDAMLAVLLNDLAALDADLILVLDDFHVVTSLEVRDHLTVFLERLPDQVHVVIAGRSDPALPLARWRASGDLLEIRASDLRFTFEEAMTYLRDVSGLGLDADDVALLEDRTEGWIAALQLAALSMRGRHDLSGFISGFAGDDRFVVDYLVEEVLSRQAEPVRRFLLRTSVLAQMEASLCDAVVGQGGSQAMLASLERDNLFVVPLDDRRHAYRYHHLFGDVLRARLLDEEPAHVAELHARASRWCETHGDLDEAFRHALEAGDVERAADLLEVAVPALTRARREVTLRARMAAIPDDVLRLRPVLNLGHVGALMVRGELDGVDRRLAEVERWLTAGDLHPTDVTQRPVVVDHDAFEQLPAGVAVYRAAHALLTGDVAGTLEHAHSALALAREDNHVLRGSAAALLGLAHWHRGDLEPAQQWYRDSISQLHRAGNLSDVLGCSLALADIQQTMGRLADALSTFQEGLRLGTAQDPPLRGTSDMHVGLARVLGEMGDLTGAMSHLQDAQGLGEHAGLPQNAYRWRLESARIREAQGDIPEALHLIGEAEEVFTTDFSPDVRPLKAVRARLHLVQGELVPVAAWARDALLGTGDAPAYLREYEHLTLVRLHLARARAGQSDDLDDTIALLGRLEVAAVDGGRIGSVIEILALRALALQAAREDGAALATLARAVEHAAGPGYVRVFLDEGTPILVLLQQLARRADAPDHAHRLLAVARGTAPSEARAQATLPSSPTPTLVEPLSARELDVVRLLASDLDGPEIARALVVSVNTVRTHTKNIYSKLGVNSRRAAVRRARELGFLGDAGPGPR
ncbi:LuxR C-terminal-related transcriptional regulator [Actinotalea sp.]|uniref:LuxR C-terminal-related transcriptional regulator n=1 Tax=Actinotalea sp. TaxID=1872145 RepID=UPI0035646BAE